MLVEDIISPLMDINQSSSRAGVRPDTGNDNPRQLIPIKLLLLHVVLPLTLSRVVDVYERKEQGDRQQ